MVTVCKLLADLHYWNVTAMNETVKDVKPGLKAAKKLGDEDSRLEIIENVLKNAEYQ